MTPCSFTGGYQFSEDPAAADFLLLLRWRQQVCLNINNHAWNYKVQSRRLSLPKMSVWPKKTGLKIKWLNKNKLLRKVVSGKSFTSSCYWCQASYWWKSFKITTLLCTFTNKNVHTLHVHFTLQGKHSSYNPETLTQFCAFAVPARNDHMQYCSLQSSCQSSSTQPPTMLSSDKPHSYIFQPLSGHPQATQIHKTRITIATSSLYGYSEIAIPGCHKL